MRGGGIMNSEPTLAEVLWELEALRGRTAAEIALETHEEAREAIERSKSGMSYLIRDVLDGPIRARELLDERDIAVRVTPIGLNYGDTIIAQRERVVMDQVDYEETMGATRWFDNPDLASILSGVIFVWYLRDVDSSGAYPVIWTDLWIPSAEQATQMQWDYSQIREEIAAGEHLRSSGSILNTCPRHGGGFDRDDPSASDQGSLNRDHPTLEAAERRAWELKRGAVETILERSLRRVTDEGGLAVADVFPAIGLDADTEPENFDDTLRQLMEDFVEEQDR
jgi:hypothetical protein